MSTKSIIVLLSLACLIGTFQVANAFKFEQCDETFGSLISMSVNQCPTQEGPACNFDYSKPLIYDLKFYSQVNYQQALTFVEFNGHQWASNACDKKGNCPGKRGSKLTVRNQFGDMHLDGEYTGPVTIRVKNENLETMVCVRFMATGHKTD